MYRAICVLLLIIAVMAGSCADHNPDAPLVDQAHPPGWLAVHDAEARQDLDSCRACHGAAFEGSGEAVSCFLCHFEDEPDFRLPLPHPLPFTNPFLHGPPAKNDLAFCQRCHGRPGTTDFAGGGVEVGCTLCHPDAGAHPTNWQGTNDPTGPLFFTHWGSGNLQACAICHNVTADLAPGNRTPGPAPRAPSCFAPDFTNALGSATACHPGGPVRAPHPLDRSYFQPQSHGPDARADLTFCQACHGEPGGPGSNPRFNVGILRVLGTGCEGCHVEAGAHPFQWIAPGRTHSSAGNFRVACALCHGAELQGGVGTACTLCHPNLQAILPP